MKIEHVLLASCVVFSLPNLTQNRDLTHNRDQPNTEQREKKDFVPLSKQKDMSSHFQSKKIFRHTFKANIYFVALSKQNYNFCHTFKAKRFHHAFKAKKDNNSF